MTEDEAKTKRCPVGAGEFVGMAVGRTTDGPRVNIRISNCIGSACMAWRLTELAMKPTRVHPNVLPDNWKGWTVTDDTPDANGYVEISPPKEAVERGRCGLAGE